jgi:hypothetical protein
LSSSLRLGNMVGGVGCGVGAGVGVDVFVGPQLNTRFKDHPSFLSHPEYLSVRVAVTYPSLTVMSNVSGAVQ